MLIVMRSFGKKTPEHAAALDRVRHWTRARFTLADDATVLVLELACTIPGCPPVDTVVAFWTDKGRHHFRIFKPVAEVVADDLPPGWMKNALVVLEGADCECC